MQEDLWLPLDKRSFGRAPLRSLRRPSPTSQLNRVDKYAYRPGYMEGWKPLIILFGNHGVDAYLTSLVLLSVCFKTQRNFPTQER